MEDLSCWLLRWAKIEGSSATLILTRTINEDSSSLGKPDRFNSPATQYSFFFTNKRQRNRETREWVEGWANYSCLKSFSLSKTVWYFIHFYSSIKLSLYFTRTCLLAMENCLNAFFSQQIMVHICLILRHTNDLCYVKYCSLNVPRSNNVQNWNLCIWIQWMQPLEKILQLSCSRFFHYPLLMCNIHIYLIN